MNSLFILNETFTNGYRIEILNFISVIAIVSGILVIISKNPIVSVLFLIGLFLSISSYNFLAIQVIVYL
jgi:NADH-ubiquinone oxidoreductase chain 6